MRGPITVSLVAVTSTDDGLGNVSESTSSTSYDEVRFAPRSSGERADPHAPAVITGGTLYRRGAFPVTSDDRITITGQNALIDGTWQVEGDPGYWGAGVEVAIVRAN